MTDSGAPRPWRCFVAVPLPTDLRASLQSWVAGLRQDGSLDADWRWTDPAGWHITLAFIGATSPDDVADLGDRLAVAVRGQDAFAVAAGGVGGFPKPSHARVLWYGIHDVDGRLAELARLVSDAAGVEGQAFRPHVTIARARDPHGTPMPALATTGLAEASLAVGSIHLMRSHLGHGPARYESLVEVALSTPMPAGLPA